MWSFLVPAAAVLQSRRTAHPQLTSVSSVCLAAFLGHYFYRSFVYPALMRPGRPTPVHIWAAASLFTAFNGAMQVPCCLPLACTVLHNTSAVDAVQALELVHCTRSTEHWTSLRAVGMCLWMTGLLLNMQSDSILRGLRRGRQHAGKLADGCEVAHGSVFTAPLPCSAGQHFIPHGSLFEYVSAANYTSEWLEWCVQHRHLVCCCC